MARWRLSTGRTRPVDVHPIDPYDDAALREWHRVHAAGQEGWGRLDGSDPYEWIAANVRHRPADEPTWLWLVTDGGSPAGAVWANAWGGHENRHRLDVDVELLPGVPMPADVLAAMSAYAGPMGRTVLGLETREGSAYQSAAVAAGAKLGQVELRSVAATKELDRTQLERWAEAPAGYSLLAFAEPCPGDLVDDFARLRTAMNDAPRGDLDIKDFVYPVPQVRDGERARRDAGEPRWVVCARHDATGELVALTELQPSVWRPRLVDQGDTVVVQAHRGHRLGLAIKSVNLLRLLDERPDADGVETWNAADNEHMLAVNRALGFRPRERWPAYELRLDSAAP